MSPFSFIRGIVRIIVSIALAAATFFHPHTTLPPIRSTQDQPTTVSQAASSTTTFSTTTLKVPLSKPVSKPISAPETIPAPTPVVSKNTTPPTLPEPSIPASPSLSPDQVNTMLRASLVNVLCTTVSGGYFNPISGSGVIIDSRGVILTNAHVAQFFLLRDYGSNNNIQCVIRTGSPATAQYTAELLYLPPVWVKDNASQITSSDPVGNGENDYAFLRITGTTSGAPLPSSFPAIPMTTDEPTENLETVVAAYPAQFLGGASIQMDLYASSAVTTISHLYTFATSTVDAFSVGHTIVSQSGSSGGGVARVSDGALVGIIATASAGTTTVQRDLHAISLSYINRSLEAAGQGGIAQFLLSGRLAQRAKDFNENVAPTLTRELENALR